MERISPNFERRSVNAKARDAFLSTVGNSSDIMMDKTFPFRTFLKLRILLAFLLSCSVVTSCSCTNILPSETRRHCRTVIFLRQFYDILNVLCQRVYPLMPKRKDLCITAKPRRLDYELANYTYNLHKHSDIVNWTFKFLWCVFLHARLIIPPPRRLCNRRCLFVCLSVSNFAQKPPNEFAWNFQGRFAMGQ